jgi:hypothetical protein
MLKLPVGNTPFMVCLAPFGTAKLPYSVNQRFVKLEIQEHYLVVPMRALPAGDNLEFGCHVSSC